MEADKIAGQKLGACEWGWSGEKGEAKDWGELGGVGGLRWRKDRYRSREEDILIKGAILGSARDLALEGIPGDHGDVPS